MIFDTFNPINDGICEQLMGGALISQIMFELGLHLSNSESSFGTTLESNICYVFLCILVILTNSLYLQLALEVAHWCYQVMSQESFEDCATLK